LPIPDYLPRAREVPVLDVAQTAGVLVGLGCDILGCCVFKLGGADRLDAYGTGGTCGFDAFAAQAVVYWWDHPCRHEHCDKLHVPDDLQMLWLDFGRDASYLTIDYSGV